MDLERWYDDIRKGNEESMLAFHLLNETQKTNWQVVYNRFDNVERKYKAALERIGELSMLHPEDVPIWEA